MWHHLYHVFIYIYIYSLLIEKDICNRQNVSGKPLCLYVCISLGDPFIFSVRVSSSFSSCCVIKKILVYVGDSAVILITDMYQLIVYNDETGTFSAIEMK